MQSEIVWLRGVASSQKQQKAFLSVLEAILATQVSMNFLTILNLCGLGRVAPSQQQLKTFQVQDMTNQLILEATPF